MSHIHDCHDWSDIETARRLGQPLHQLDFRGLDLRGKSLANLLSNQVQWVNANFDFCDLRQASFVECDLRGVNLSTALMGDTSFVRCRMDGVSLPSGLLERVNF
ncbi:MAG: pentapeptide repeat-containing protein, partial [Betaproteobacteria bacterium]|nr:pentapeptide repeat-containing protein [Betaproteobacteria bacterium]